MTYAEEGGRADARPHPAMSGTRARAYIEVRDVSKRFGGAVALDHVSLTVASGTIHGIVGENGAGKSTLMKVLAGVVTPDSGKVLLNGSEVKLQSPLEAAAHGISIVYQELSLFPSRSVIANLFANHELARFGVLDVAAMVQRAEPLLKEVGLDLDPRVRVESLTLAERQRIELCRALLRSAHTLILDEPNSALSAQETERLFGLLRTLAERGVTILYVSHRLEELFEICTDVTVLRNGRDVLSQPIPALSMRDVAAAMIGRSESGLYPPPSGAATGAATVATESLSVTRAFSDVSVEAHAGEIVGLAGLEGSGASTLLETLFGLHRPSHGTATYPDGRGLPGSPTEAARRGIALVPADRRVQGLMPAMSVAFNMGHVTAGTLKGRFLLTPRDLAVMAHRQVESLRIVTHSVSTHVDALSGGNQQKVVLGKWMAAEPRVLLLDDPTRGVDIGAKEEIYRLVRRWADEGRVVLMTSSELPELVGLCDRTYVVFRGRVVGEVPRGILDARGLLHAINTGQIVTPG